MFVQMGGVSLKTHGVPEDIELMANHTGAFLFCVWLNFSLTNLYCI